LNWSVCIEWTKHISSATSWKFGTASDNQMLGLAVEIVELKHPHLVGGLGLYSRGRTPYVHIDTRGKKTRWRG